MKLKKTSSVLIRSLLLGVSLGLCSTSVLSADQDKAKSSFSDEQTQDIQTIMHDYLLKNPEIIVQAIQEMQKKQAAEAMRASLQAVKDNATEIFSTDDAPLLGNPKGSVMISEFFDYQCGHCKVMEPVMDKLIKDNPNLTIILRELPIFGGASKLASEASLAVYQLAPTQYAAYHEALLSEKDPLTEEIIMQKAVDLGLDKDKLKKVMASEDVEKALRANFVLMQKLKIQGTPFFAVANQDLSVVDVLPGAGDAEALQKKIDEVAKSQ